MVYNVSLLFLPDVDSLLTSLILPGLKGLRLDLAAAVLALLTPRSVK